MSDTFKQKTAAPDGDYLWSYATNWSTGIAPIDGDSVSSALAGYDDIAGLGLASLTLTLGGDVSVIAPALDVATASGVNGSILGADAYDAGAPVTVTVDSITGSGAIYLASGAGAVLRDESATDLGENFYAANDGLIELSATPASTSELIYDGGVAAFALKDPGASNAVKIFYLGQGDVLELPGTSVTGATFGTDSLSVTTNDGTYAFTDVTYATGMTVEGYTAAYDSTTGLEAITFTVATVFKQTTADDGRYLWSNATNWSTSLAPIDGDSVSSALQGYDDIAGLSLASLALSLGGDVSVIAPTLDVATASGVNGSILGADAYDAGAPVTVTVDSITGSGAIYLASGAGAVLRDESATDLGENFYAANDGLIELSATPASTSELIYDGGVAAFALKDPDASNAVKIFYLGQGDVLELPGTSVTGATFGTDSLSVTTNDGTYAFTDVTYATGMTVEGYTAAYDSTTGLEAITFTVATVFKQTTADDGRYLWSNATNWSTSLAPIDGDSVSSALQGYDDIAGLSLASLALTLGGDVSVIAPTLDVATVSGVNGSILGADAYDAGAPVTVTVDSITGSGAIYLASGAGAVLRDESATDLGENFYAANGGLIELSATPASTSELIYDGGVAAFALKDPGATNAVKIFYLGRGDVLELPGTSVTHVTFGTDSLSVTTNDGSYAFTDVTYATGTPVSSYSAAFDDTTGLEAITFLACYARGTRIATPSGNRPIEDLVAGDLVQARFAGTVPVRWVGRRHLDCRRHVDPGTVWPVRIAAGAFGDNLPVRDLYLSPDHAVFIDDVLVPVRQLINGVSIAPQAVDQITYFHIELDRHDVVLAEELPAETYLDTGHRAAFDNAGLPMRLHPTFVTAAATDRAPGCCAPLAVAPDRVEPIWRRLAARAGSPAGRPDATTDPHLRLACAGRATRPLLAADSRYIFALPPGQDCVRIASRAAAPTDLRPWLDDRRRLGVAVSRIVLRGRHDVIDLPVDHPALVDGWHPPETDGARRWRWTDGNAALPLPPGTRVMELHLAGSMHYPVGKRQPPCTVLPVFYISDICSA